MGRKGAMGRKALESVYQNLPKKERGEILHAGFGHKFLRPINISLKIYHFVTIGELCDIKKLENFAYQQAGAGLLEEARMV